MSVDIDVGRAKVIAKHSGTDETTAMLALQEKRRQEEQLQRELKSYPSPSRQRSSFKEITHPSVILYMWAAIAIMAVLFAHPVWALLFIVGGWYPAFVLWLLLG